LGRAGEVEGGLIAIKTHLKMGVAKVL